MRRMLRRIHSGAFTLIELMVVMVILGILATLIMPKIMERPEQAKRTKAKVQIELFRSALQQFKLDTGRYPTTAEGLEALATDPGNVKGYQKGGYMEKVPQDPWGNKYVYQCPGKSNRDFDITCYGADGQPSGTGYDADIESWNLEGN